MVPRNPEHPSQRMEGPLENGGGCLGHNLLPASRAGVGAKGGAVNIPPTRVIETYAKVVGSGRRGRNYGR